MAYDEGLAERIREGLAEQRDVTEKKMFGGVAFMLRGSMFVGIVKEDLMVRVGAEAHEDALREPHARTMDFTGKPMRGYVYVAPPGYAQRRRAPGLARARPRVREHPPRQGRGPKRAREGRSREDARDLTRARSVPPLNAAARAGARGHLLQGALELGQLP